MTTDRTPPSRVPDSGQPPRRTSSFFWVLFIGGIVVLVFLAVLPLITTWLAVALWGLGGSGSNK